MELIVLGCSGSYGAPPSGACSGYLVRTATANVWIDCGNGTFEHLQRHVAIEDLSAVVVTHLHPDHCSDLHGLHVLARWGVERTGIPVFAPAGSEERLGVMWDAGWGSTFAWADIEDGDRVRVGDIDLRFTRTDHPPPTYAVEASADGRRLVYTSDTGPGWAVDAFGAGADLVVSEATYLHAHRPVATHLSAMQAGQAAREARARRLMVTHVWPRVSRDDVRREASEAFGDDAVSATMNEVTPV